MVKYITIALISYMVGAIKMKTITDFLKGEVNFKIERNRKAKVISEKAFFKSNFKRYYAKHTDIGETEFWAHLTVPKSFHFQVGDEQAYNLGKYNGKEILKPKDFYNLPWDVQNGANRLYVEFMQSVNNR